MSDQIEIGDLVQVVRSCCTKRVQPPTFVVGKIEPAYNDYGQTFCSDCMKLMPDVAMVFPASGRVAQPITWLKRIPPLSELDDVRQDEEIAA